MHIFAKNSDRYPLNMQNNTKIRQQAILEIIQAGPVFSQDELATRLKEAGIASTQATLSRDLKALQIVKGPTGGYRLPQQKAVPPSSLQGILSIEFAGQNAVIKTQPGYAAAVAARIDHRPCAAIMGTLAGDDTILLVLRLGFSPEEVLENLKPIIPDILEYLI